MGVIYVEIIYRSYYSYNLVIDCGEPQEIGNSTEDREGGTKYNAHITYTCLPGFESIGGSLNRTCQPNADWSGDLPICQGMCFIYNIVCKLRMNNYGITFQILFQILFQQLHTLQSFYHTTLYPHLTKLGEITGKS